MLCSARTRIVPKPNDCATPYWNGLKRMFDTVFDPDKKAPNTPILGANANHAMPVAPARAEAGKSNMLANPDVLFDELIRICTSDSVRINAKVAGINFFITLKIVDVITFGFSLNANAARTVPTKKMNPGEYRISHEKLRVVLRIEV